MSFKLDKPTMFSTDGYKRDSKDVNNKQNLIACGDITMKDVDLPVHGVDNLGNEKIMEPGKDYSFPGDIVLETPLTKKEMPDFDEGTKGFKMGGFPMIDGTASHLKQKKDAEEMSDFDKAFAEARSQNKKQFDFTGSDGKTRPYNTFQEGESGIIDASKITGVSGSFGVQGKGGSQSVHYPIGGSGHLSGKTREDYDVNDPGSKKLYNLQYEWDEDRGRNEGINKEEEKRVAEDYSGKNK